jgi:hypothetical protein
MSRRYVNRTPVERAITSSEAAQQFFRLFTDTFEHDFRSREVQEDIERLRQKAGIWSQEHIARNFQGIVWGVISAILSRGGKLGSMIAELDSADRDRLLQQIGDFAVALTDPTIGIEQRSLIWCTHHGYTSPLGRRRCQQCPCELPARYSFDWSDPKTRTEIIFYRRIYPDAPGRRPMYCSNACRQRAYRQRLRADRDTQRAEE